ncbi:MAG: type I restriction endonuclease [Defluviitaleaceae bacterium]|nr:type I restriction endonuclease [Defluviitaleaceae bacterium]
MDFIDELRQFSTRLSNLKDVVTTEEATKNAMVLPFFQMMGYDVFNPLEFVPEYAANFGVKKDARVDYAIMIDGNPVILIECKSCNEILLKHSGQLFQYFAATPAKFGILTNGLVYQFFTDLNEQNKMDAEPFLEMNLLDINENIVSEVKRFAKKTLDIQGAFTAAAELKYMGKIKELLDALRSNPEDNFVRFIMANIYSGKATQKAINEFRPIIKRGFVQYINDAISETIKSAMNRRDHTTAEATAAESITTPETDDDQQDDGSPMSMDEFEAFVIVKSILRDIINVERLAYRHAKDYMAILLDNNKNKRICRFWFKRGPIHMTTPDENKKPIRRDISCLNDIYIHAEHIREVCSRYI